jgi:hypothetical protein
MSDYNKVTIIVENDTETVTITAPVAIDVKLDSRAKIIDELFRDKREWPRFQPEIMDLTLTMTAFFSDADGHTYLVRKQQKSSDV